jgi:hypothetical protein
MCLYLQLLLMPPLLLAPMICQQPKHGLLCLLKLLPGHHCIEGWWSLWRVVLRPEENLQKNHKPGQ